MYKFTKFNRDYAKLKDVVILNYQEGLKCKQIATKLDLDRRTVGKWLKEAGFIYSSCNKANIDSTVFNEIDNQEKAYWLGFLFADGYVSKESNFELSLGLKDLEHLEKFKEFLKFEGKIYIDNKVGRCRLQFQDSEIVKALKLIGCINKKSLVLMFPLINDSLVHHFIRGYFDGDGCINHPKERITIQIVGTYMFLKKLHKFANLSVDNIKHRNPKHSLEVFTDAIHGQSARSFCEYIYNNSIIHLERKYKRFINHSENFKLWKNGKKYKGHTTARIS